jgi:putative intracellular protease/amidase
VKTVAVDLQPKVSIGGLRTEVDYCIGDYSDFSNVGLNILPGGYTWMENNYDAIADFVKRAEDSATPIAAICGATLFLGKHGFLNEIKHTGDEKEYFLETLGCESRYEGKDNFVSAQLVHDKGFITANETAALDFAVEIFKTLGIDTNEEISQWRDKYKNGMFRSN